jgi:hypothetical protein
MINFKNIIGIVFIMTGVLDALKYNWEARKVKESQSSKTHSRKFINCALLNDIIKLLYGICILDTYIILTSLIAIFTMCNLWWQIYLFYPYKYRNLKNWKRPNVFVYFINSLIPNIKRKHL